MPRKKLDPNEPHLAPQVTLRGRSAYVLQCLVELRGGEPADTARWIIDSWINSDEGRKALANFGIDPLAYKRVDDNVVPMREKRN